MNIFKCQNLVIDSLWNQYVFCFFSSSDEAFVVLVVDFLTVCVSV